jgi:chromosome segregation ATPase
VIQEELEELEEKTSEDAYGAESDDLDKDIDDENQSSARPQLVSRPFTDHSLDTQQDMPEWWVMSDEDPREQYQENMPGRRQSISSIHSRGSTPSKQNEAKKPTLFESKDHLPQFEEIQQFYSNQESPPRQIQDQHDDLFASASAWQDSSGLEEELQGMAQARAHLQEEARQLQAKVKGLEILVETHEADILQTKQENISLQEQLHDSDCAFKECKHKLNALMDKSEYLHQTILTMQRAAERDAGIRKIFEEEKAELLTQVNHYAYLSWGSIHGCNMNVMVYCMYYECKKIADAIAAKHRVN